MLITNGKKTVEVTLREWEGLRYSADYAADVFVDGYMEYNVENDCYITHDMESFLYMIDDCINENWGDWGLEFTDDEIITINEIETPDELKLLA